MDNHEGEKLKIVSAYYQERIDTVIVKKMQLITILSAYIDEKKQEKIQFTIPKSEHALPRDPR